MSGQMGPSLRILSAGPGVSVQDGGRHGFLRYGVTVAGPMDPLAHAIANRVLENPTGSAALEVSLGGVEVTAEGGYLAVAVAGGAFEITLDGRPMPPALYLALEPGARLRIRAGQSGAWCYLAAAGGIDVPEVLGSRATHTRSHLGGYEGRAVRAGDILATNGPSCEMIAPLRIDAPALDRPAEVIRVMPGPQADYFTEAAHANLLAGPWTIGPRGDRMACFLEGPTLTHSDGFNIVSDGITMGAIQVPGEGQPIVLMADRQPTGGYPKIATVIGADLGRLAQARPGTRIRFRNVTHDEAVLARQQEAAILARGFLTEPLVRTHFTSEFLLGVNLIDGVFSGPSSTA
jgi:5-oxoprolinase (ATP-hydrolysing) subunit C